ncbi:MAG: ParM/StbA family protein [Thermodesulfobacterium sp.]|nr:ParM/StbA family protein [Thermodesulfobacterium sp.]
MRVIGIDIGFGQVKVVSENLALKFPSQIAQFLEGELSDVPVVQHNGLQYVVGEEATAFRHKLSLSTVELLIRYSPVLLKRALMEIGEGGEYFVVSGLPPRFRHMGDEFSRVLKSVEGVKEVWVVPQGAGILEDVKDYILAQGGALILDIGFNTVDYLSVRVKGNDFIKERGGTIEGLGVKSAVEIFRNLLPPDLGFLRNEPYVFLVPYFAKGRASLVGKEFLLQEEKAKASKLWTEQIYLRLQEEIGELIIRKPVFVVAGGGAYFIDRTLFGRHLYIPVEPDFSNARGYFRLGVETLKRMF